MRTLVVGDENFSFSVCLAGSPAFPADELDVACGIQEDQVKDEAKPRVQELRDGGSRVHFGVNPAQLRNSFSSGCFDRLILVLPGLAYHGCPPLVGFGSDLFVLRLHLFCFSVLKSSRGVVRPNAEYLLLWPSRLPTASLKEFPEEFPAAGADAPDASGDAEAAEEGKKDAEEKAREEEKGDARETQEAGGEETAARETRAAEEAEEKEGPAAKETLVEGEAEPKTNALEGFPMIDMDRLAKFCSFQRPSNQDFRLSLSRFEAWRPAVHRHESPENGASAALFEGVEEKTAAWLGCLVFHALRLQEDGKKAGGNPEDFNILRVPASVMQHSREVLPHVNELFLFKLFGSKSASLLVSKLSLKYDPRIAGWRGQGLGAQRPPGGSPSGAHPVPGLWRQATAFASRGPGARGPQAPGFRAPARPAGPFYGDVRPLGPGFGGAGDPVDVRATPGYSRPVGGGRPFPGRGADEGYGPPCGSAPRRPGVPSPTFHPGPRASFGGEHQGYGGTVGPGTGGDSAGFPNAQGYGNFSSSGGARLNAGPGVMGHVGQQQSTVGYSQGGVQDPPYSGYGPGSEPSQSVAYERGPAPHAGYQVTPASNQGGMEGGSSGFYQTPTSYSYGYDANEGAPAEDASYSSHAFSGPPSKRWRTGDPAVSSQPAAYGGYRQSSHPSAETENSYSYATPHQQSYAANGAGSAVTQGSSRGAWTGGNVSYGASAAGVETYFGEPSQTGSNYTALNQTGGNVGAGGSRMHDASGYYVQGAAATSGPTYSVNGASCGSSGPPASGARWPPAGASDSNPGGSARGYDKFYQEQSQAFSPSPSAGTYGSSGASTSYYGASNAAGDAASNMGSYASGGQTGPVRPSEGGYGGPAGPTGNAGYSGSNAGGQTTGYSMGYAASNFGGGNAGAGATSSANPVGAGRTGASGGYASYCSSAYGSASGTGGAGPSSGAPASGSGVKGRYAYGRF
ncbi:hypothetical protein TGME49_320010 [Toxoplasma gondii ME49]|uniref:Uncharacterized protein n=3 Tax=Toxoplasma gondii TaxID=5811 RepID=S7VT14_TOXGG|nr:hypothetical protein TGME49_320010 [Toxoplasma gondii ME49]EPR58174.1 hypothetical protein TGGT1_320010 [Toxoplasma gondii GT1]EPT31546.1 hypothetical protein TGME49_320010 [Toxoplasma gondii ME49]|eukprot:XP_002369868.1 hypothetical protein TGME49_320010 [Toxoplasma gondii ME49]